MIQNFTVKAILRKDKIRKDGTCPINFRVTINKKSLKISSGEFIKEVEWNNKAGLVKGSKSSHLNSVLENEISRIKDFLREQRSIGTYLNLEIVKAFLKTNDRDDFYEYYDNFCELRFLEIEEGTQRHYNLTRKRLKEFKSKITFREINIDFIEKFDYFLRKKLNTGIEGVFSRHKNLKTILSQAKKRKIIKDNPYEDFKLKRGVSKYGYLTDEELETIQNLDFRDVPNGAGLELSRDMFLFACYCGLRCSDISNLAKENILQDKISIIMKKTKSLVEVPLTKKAEILLKKYTIASSEKIFPFRTNQCLNRDLKTIAEMCKIDKVITFHMARHSFATIMANYGVNVFLIMKLLGHKDIRMTQIYVNPNHQILASKLGEIKAFN
ncbi:MAG: hypothetical protein CFE23_09345 [Flavobacterium sp. BFFFF1]|uniref:site-specific integrase n=1 Tax=Flavobacterium sp. BFFFF1 TaxID=2015557 RepID=UPI000BC8AD70|nr:site-specific integrase [Flavobacterium sp. BFFFF1]OYU80451.1 MAG: hypothetical protein CFE23_09345 [Flavobacterium sp. BFFFF1]